MANNKNFVVAGSAVLTIGAVAAIIFKLFSKEKVENFSNEEIEESLANSLEKNPSKKKKEQTKKLIKILIAKEKGGNKEAEDSLNFIQEEGAEWSKKLVATYRKKPIKTQNKKA
ncbi:MAG TPA: hypothetical protein PKX30_02690 [Candidatus Pacearchaeota archaeon]|nr:hypothetical protein [Candidatus Pacearchaeota archaeon]